MLFCPKCGSLLKPKLDGSTRVMLCSCGFKDKEAEHVALVENLSKDKNKEETRNDSVIETEHETLPVTDAFCGKCKNNKAYYWLVQTRAADEAPTKFLRCTKCRNTWRDYS